MEQAKSENLVVCLPTGSGKTYIAIMLIKEMSNKVRRSIDEGGKRTVFLVNTGLSFVIFAIKLNYFYLSGSCSTTK